MLGNVQALRALAALMVVVVHVYAVESTYLPGRPWTTPFHVAGTYGVDLFFVISGVVMIASTAGWFAQPGAWRRFLIHRVTRIYPPYWIVTALVLVVFVVDPGATGVHRSARPDIVASFLAWPQAGEPLLVVGWTLSYELLFYAVFAVGLCFDQRRLPIVALVWFAIIVAVHVFGSPANPWVRVAGSPLCVEFLLGMIVGVAVLRRAYVAPRIMLAVGVASIVAVCIVTAYAAGEFEPIAPWRPLAIGVPMTLIVYGALGLEFEGFVAPAWLRAQGDASYALYLWHVLVIGALGAALHVARLHGTLARVTIVVGGYALAIVVSLAIYRWLERPLLRVMRGRLDRAASSAGRSAAAQRS